MSSPQLDEVLSSIDITIQDVYAVLHSLDPTKAMGVDLIGPMVRVQKPYVLLSIRHLFSVSLSTSQLPDE